MFYYQGGRISPLPYVVFMITLLKFASRLSNKSWQTQIMCPVRPTIVADVVVGDVTSVLHNHQDWMMHLSAVRKCAQVQGVSVLNTQKKDKSESENIIDCMKLKHPVCKGFKYSLALTL